LENPWKTQFLQDSANFCEKNPFVFKAENFDLQIFKNFLLAESGNIKRLRAKKLGNRGFLDFQTSQPR